MSGSSTTRWVAQCGVRAQCRASQHQLSLKAAISLPSTAAAEAHRNLDEPDAETIRAALEAAGGTVSRAARALGLSRQALYRRMQRFELSAD